MSEGEGRTTETLEQPFAPTDPLAAATVKFLRERFAEYLEQFTEHRGEVTVVVSPQAIQKICQALCDEPTLQYDFLADLTAVDWREREPRYDVVYHLLSLQTRAVLRLKVSVGDEITPDPQVPTVTTVWPAANFFEREVFDLFGIRFTGHPNMTRILMPSDWVGYPLRKDYPLTGIHLPDPHWGGQIPLRQALPMGTGQQTLRTADRIQAPAVAKGPGSSSKPTDNNS
jgi:NADH-quinone oxidoreductase subunit C